MIKPIFFIFVIAAVISTCLVAQAKVLGPGDGGGGNAPVAEFLKMGRYFNDFIDGQGSRVDATFPTAELQAVIGRWKVKAVQGPLELDGEKVDAINYPRETRVELDDDTWSKRSVSDKYQNVIHEILGLLEIKDEIDGQGYLRSQRLAERTFPKDGDFSSGSTSSKPRSFVREIYSNAVWMTKPDAYCAKPSSSISRSLEAMAQEVAMFDCIRNGYLDCSPTGVVSRIESSAVGNSCAVAGSAKAMKLPSPAMKKRRKLFEVAVNEVSQWRYLNNGANFKKGIPDCLDIDPAHQQARLQASNQVLFNCRSAGARDCTIVALANSNGSASWEMRDRCNAWAVAEGFID